ncbi:hypothetical protein PINS_up014321 [Pythium insidiosum]|nr:hypothetical protein PINS_up014321 [Pythium insidiosum]
MATTMISDKAHAECVRLLELLTNKRVQESWSWVFMSPVTDIPGYHEIIKKPMDLGTVKKNLGSKPSRCRFKSHDKFARDVRLVFQNALLYNKDDEQVKGSVYDAAQHLLRVFDTAYAKSVDTVFKDEAVESAGAGDDATPSADKASEHHNAHSSSDGGDGSGHKHKKEKKEKKEKKSKKSKKKSKDRDKDREKDREKDRDKDKERKKHKSSSSSSSSGSKGDTHAHVSQVPPTAPTISSSSPTAVPKATSVPDHRPNAATSAAPSGSVPPSPSPTASATKSTSNAMSEEAMAACQSVLMKIIKYKEGSVSPAAPFLQPVDLNHFPDYRIKVPHRMHLYGVQKKLRSGGYADKDAFARDVRRIFSNCLIYNSDVVLSKVMRTHAITLMKLFETQFAKLAGGVWPGVSKRWECHQILHEILAHRTLDGQETAQWFKYPIQTYFDSPEQIPYGYFKTVKQPMDLGTVSERLHLGMYKDVSSFIHDLKLVFDNCILYWSSDPHGQTYCDSAKALLGVLRNNATQAFGATVTDSVFSRSGATKLKSRPPRIHRRRRSHLRQYVSASYHLDMRLERVRQYLPKTRRKSIDLLRRTRSLRSKKKPFVWSF